MSRWNATVRYKPTDDTEKTKVFGFDDTDQLENIINSFDWFCVIDINIKYINNNGKILSMAHLLSQNDLEMTSSQAFH